MLRDHVNTLFPDLTWHHGPAGWVGSIDSEPLLSVRIPRSDDIIRVRCAPDDQQDGWNRDFTSPNLASVFVRKVIARAAEVRRQQAAAPDEVPDAR